MSIMARVPVIAMAIVCVAGAAMADVVINEVYYDSPGTDAGVFTELKGTPGMSLDGYFLVGVNGNGGVDYAFVSLDGHSIPGDGYFVVGKDSLVTEADMINTAVDWQNGPDEVELRYANPDTVVIDGVCYGDAGGSLDCEGGTYAVDVTAGSSIGRCPDGNDTNDNAADFAEGVPTPGATNDCEELPPTPRTCAEIQEDDADGFPLLFGERVIVSDCLVLVASGVFHGTYLDLHVTDGTGCIQLFDFNWEFPPNEDLAEGDVVEVVGTVAFYNGMVELSNIESIVITGSAMLPEPVDITTAGLAMGGEAYESCLIKICGVYTVEGEFCDEWPLEGQNANMCIDDGTGQAIMRLDVDTDIDGSPVVEEPFTVTGIVTQYDTSAPWDSGYQIKPRRRSEIQDGVDCPTPIQKSSWGQIKNQYR